MSKFKQLTLAVVLVNAIAVTSAWADVKREEPLTSGKPEVGKGTKASEQYQAEGRAGGPVYEYGKGLQIGPVHIKPNLQYSREWENNVFYDEGNRKEDWTHHIIGDLTAELPFNGGQHLATVAYILEHEAFDRYDDQDHTDHNLKAGLNLNFVPFSVSADHAYKRTVDRSNTEFTNRTSREENNSHVLVEIPFSSFFLEEELFNQRVDFRLPENSQFDHNELAFYQRIGYDLTPSTQLLLEYGYLNLDYSKVGDRDGDGNQFMVGMRGNLSARIAYQAWVGAQFRIYDENSRPDYHNVIAKGALQYDITEKSYVILKADRVPQESTFDNQSYYVRNRAEFLWKQQLAERFFFNTREIVQHNDYSRISTLLGDQRTRRDWVWQTGLGVEYFMPNELISIFAEYRFNSRDSNLPTLDYDAQTVSFGIRSSF